MQPHVSNTSPTCRCMQEQHVKRHAMAPCLEVGLPGDAKHDDEEQAGLDVPVEQEGHEKIEQQHRHASQGALCASWLCSPGQGIQVECSDCVVCQQDLCFPVLLTAKQQLGQHRSLNTRAASLVDDACKGFRTFMY